MDEKFGLASSPAQVKRDQKKYHTKPKQVPGRNPGGLICIKFCDESGYKSAHRKTQQQINHIRVIILSDYTVIIV